MNRIRQKDDKYQLLITPHLFYSPSMELIVGGWDDEHLKGFDIEEYDALDNAQYKAFQMPDIDWYKLVRMNSIYFNFINTIINKVIKKYHFKVHIDSHIMSPNELKNVTFDRVHKLGERYTMTHNMNDIISFCIINPWTINLEKLSKILISIPELRIRKKFIYYGHVIHLVGLTELGSTYEIKLWPSIIHQWALWESKHSKGKDKDSLNRGFRNMLKQQLIVDDGYTIR